MATDAFDEASQNEVQLVWLELARMVYEHGEGWLKTEEFRSHFGNYERTMFGVSGLNDCLNAYQIRPLEAWHFDILVEVGAIPDDIRKRYLELQERQKIEVSSDLDCFGPIGRYVLLNLPIAQNRFDGFTSNDPKINDVTNRARRLHADIDALQDVGFVTASMSEQMLGDLRIIDIGYAEHFVGAVRNAYNPKMNIYRKEPLTEQEFLQIKKGFDEWSRSSEDNTHFEMVRRLEQRLEVLHRTKRGSDGELFIEPAPQDESIADIRAREARERKSRRSLWNLILRA